MQSDRHSTAELCGHSIARFLEFLEGKAQTVEYLARLVNGYNPVAARGVMCRIMLSVNYDGTLSDCDFNQMLELPVESRVLQNILDAVPDDNAFDNLVARDIVVGPHFFGCTAGNGSSCGGVVAQRSRRLHAPTKGTVWGVGETYGFEWTPTRALDAVLHVEVFKPGGSKFVRQSFRVRCDLSLGNQIRQPLRAIAAAVRNPTATNVSVPLQHEALTCAGAPATQRFS